MSDKFYICTIHIVIEASCEAEACDAISEMMSNNIESVVDWGYQWDPQHPGGYKSPVEINLPKDYHEGEAFTDHRPATIYLAQEVK